MDKNAKEFIPRSAQFAPTIPPGWRAARTPGRRLRWSRHPSRRPFCPPRRPFCPPRQPPCPPPADERRKKKKKRKGRNNVAAANAKHAYDSGLNRKRRGVRQLQPDGSLTQEFGSVAEASEATGAQPSHITECCRGKLRTTGGYRWEHVDPVAETAAYLEELVSAWEPPTQIDPASTKNVPELTEKDLENLLAGLLN